MTRQPHTDSPVPSYPPENTPPRAKFTVTGLATFVVLLAVAAVFFYAGILKITQPLAFAEAIERYRIVSRPLAIIISLFLPCLEITSAIALFFQQLRAGALALSCACSVAFACATGSALASGLDIDCGCFGGNGDVATSHGSLAFSLARAIVLVLACTWLLWRHLRQTTK